MKRIFSASVLAVAFLAACAPPFPKDMLSKLTPNVAYADLQRSPERFSGALVMVGGTIVETKNQKEGTRIEVLQKPLDSQGRPFMTDETGGRFIVHVAQFLDAAIYHRGRSVTVIAEVTGVEVHPLGEIEYGYPALSARDVHLWSSYQGPRFSFGIGVYRGF